MWHFERHERLAELITRAREQADYLYRAACDETDPAGRLALDERRRLVERRIRRWQAEARTARRAARQALMA